MGGVELMGGGEVYRMVIGVRLIKYSGCIYKNVIIGLLLYIINIWK